MDGHPSNGVGRVGMIVRIATMNIGLWFPPGIGFAIKEKPPLSRFVKDAAQEPLRL
jgi:hypothetical protein